MSLHELAENDVIFLSGGGETGALMRALDWAATPLGPPEQWPESLKTLTGVMLAANQPMLIVWGPERTTLYNDGYAAMCGARHPRALGRPFDELWFDIWDRTGPILARAYAGQSAHMDDIMFVMHRNGYPEETHFAFSYTPVRGPHGVDGMFCVCTETTRQVLAEQRLADETERQRRLFEKAPGFIVILRGPEHVFEFANEAYARLFGGREFVGRTTREVFPDLEGQGFHELLDQVYSSGERFVARQVPVRLHLQDGGTEELFLDFIYEPVIDEAGQVTGIFCEGYDITDRKRAEDERRATEAALRESEAELRLITDAVPVLISYIDADGCYRFVNRFYEEWLQTPRDKILGKPIRDVLGEAAYSEVEPSLARALSGERQTFERMMPYRLAGARHIHADYVPDVRPDGSVSGVYAVVSDITEAKQAEQALRESEARFREQFENANDFIFTADLEMRITTCNPAVAAALGRKPEELVGRSIREFVPDEVWNQNKRMLKDKLDGRETSTRYEVEVFGRDQRRMIWEINSRLTRDAVGAANGLHAIGRDVTERRDAEQTLRESEARLRALTDHLPGGMVFQIATGRDGDERRFLYVSQSHERLTGIPADAVLADPTIPYRLIHDEDRSRLAEAEAKATAARTSFDVQVRFRRADGEIRWCRIISAPREQADGSLIWDGLQIDITEQKRTEEALRVRGEEFYALADNIPMLCWMAYADGHIFWYNRRWYEYTGTSAEDQEGWGWESVHDPQILPRVVARWRQSLATGEPFEMTFPLKGADGTFRPFLTRIIPIRDDSGKIVRWFGTNVDISDQVEAERLLEQRVEQRTAELVQAQEALRQSQKLEAMGQLTGGVAHDFNNLLTPIIGSLDLLQRKGLGGEREQRLIDGAMQSAERAKTLVQRLLAFARRQPLQPTAVDVASLVTGMAELIESTSGPQIKVVVNAEPDLPPAIADQNQLEMAILNLSVNARDAMPDGGTLTISASRQMVDEGHPANLRRGCYVRLCVADTGVGMDESTLSHAIEPFFSTKGIGKGTGLGLSMAHGLASQLGGALTIASRLGLGTNVELWLPASDERVGPAERSADAAPRRDGAGRALLVDDEELVRMSTADMLAELGYDVTQASSGEEALRLLDEHGGIDVLVTDHLMPGMTGTDLARRVLETRPDMPVLIVSGYAEAESVAPELPRLTKPFRQADLAATLAGLMTPLKS
jgi:PAS domain S-box-containing protein